MVDAGYRVTAAGAEDDPEVAATLKSWGVTFRAVKLARAGLNPFADLQTLRGLVRVFRDTRPDVFFGYTAKAVTYGILAAKLAGVPRRYAMITGLGYAFTEGPELKRKISRIAAGLLYRAALPLADRVIFQNADDQGYFLSRGFVRPAQVAQIGGSGVDLEHYRQAPLPDGPVTFLMIARLLRDKGVYEYIEAARQVRKTFPNTRFVLVGALDPNPSSAKQHEIDAWVREGIIEYRGEVTDVRPHIGDCHVYVLPSYREGMPRTVLEAMAIGRGIITCDVPGCRETVVDGDNGFLVPARDAVALARAMTQFMTDADRMDAAARRSRQRATEVYEVNQVNRRMLQLLGGHQTQAVASESGVL
jgi:glycosyltransferase involved in cell wall biosynthesis